MTGAGSAAVTPWTSAEPPTRDSLERIFRLGGLVPGWWSNGPGDRYNAHSHLYHKVLYCAAGGIRFHLEDGRAFELAPGDRLDIPPGVRHSAIVGAHGVTCVEAARR